MAKPSKFVSPAKADREFVEGGAEEEEHFESEPENDDDGDDGERENANGLLKHLGSDLPDIAPDSQDSEDEEADEDTQMGNAQSTKRQVEAIHATTRQGQARTQEVAGTRASTGRLKWPSTANPEYRNPVLGTAAARQRNLGPVDSHRQSTYDVDAESPARHMLRKATLAGAKPQFSPTKAQKKQAKKAAAAPSATNSPRKSRRIQERDEEAAREERVSEQHPDIDRGIQGAHGEEEAEAGAAEPDGPEAEQHFADDNIDVSSPQDVSAEQQVANSRRRKRGRPVKHSDPAPQSSSEDRKKPGRPRKSAEDVTEASESVGTKTVRTHANLSKLILETHRIIEEVKKRQTRAAPVVQQSPSKRKALQQPRRESALAKLDERRSQRVGGSTQSTAATQQAEHTVNGDGTEKERTSIGKAMEEKRMRQMRAAVGNEDDDEEEDADHDRQRSGLPKASGSRAKKRKATAPPATAISSSKRSRFEPPQPWEQSQAVHQTQPPVDPVEGRKLFGQWPQLQLILKAIRHIGCNVKDAVRQRQNEIDLDDDAVKAAVKACNKAFVIYEEMRIHSDAIGPRRDPAQALIDIDYYVNDLRGAHESDVEFEKDNVVRCTNIYSHLVPRLLRVIESAALCYMELDRGQVEEGQITIAHLQVVNGVVDMLLDLIRGASKYNRPPSEDHVVLPIRNEINPRLRRVKKAFDRRIHQHELAQANLAWREEEKRQMANDKVKQQRIQEQRARTDKWQRKWQDMHDTRLWAEDSLLMTNDKRKHLELPTTEVDHNGESYQRDDMFGHRIGPSPGQVDLAWAVKWARAEEVVLMEGLQRYSGPHVFGKIFCAYCPRGKELNRFNVTEIVTMAARMRDHFIQFRQAKGEEVEQWVLDIPAWTRGYQALEGEGGANDNVAGAADGDVNVEAGPSGGQGEETADATGTMMDWLQEDDARHAL